MNYADISKVNSEINMIDLKGKNYAMVPERVTAFRKLFPDGFIKTEIISHDGTNVLMQAVAGYYENGAPVILASGLAQETRGKGMVNGTSYIENCETSAVGRALGMIGLGINGGGICSAEELANAVTAQRQMKEEEKAFCNPPMPEGGPVAKTDKLPKEAQDISPVTKWLAEKREEMRKERGLTAQENSKLFSDQKAALVKAGMAPDKGLSLYTMEEAEALIDAMYKNFTETGTEVIAK
ncbi:MAG: hypothetical protein II008_09235 [Oscillospiraceae bacterium]|nr:hypothetical protein [Oscillospiraceae bacterium]